MRAVTLRRELESTLGSPLSWQPRPAVETLPSGIAELDALAGGLPRGCLTEIHGPASSGRTTVLVAALGAACARGEVCALVDAAGAFDPVSGTAAGVALDRLLWVRCGGNAEHALKAVDLLVQGGGFGLVALDLGDTPPETARRISLTSWFRLRRAIEHTPTVLLAITRQPQAKTCASLSLALRRRKVAWSGAPGCSQLLRGIEIAAECRKPARSGLACFPARVLE